jgi:hypothetical protein
MLHDGKIVCKLLWTNAFATKLLMKDLCMSVQFGTSQKIMDEY